MAAESLPRDLREVVVARALQERSLRDIAERLNRPLNTVRAPFARGVRVLREVPSPA